MPNPLFATPGLTMNTGGTRPRSGQLKCLPQQVCQVLLTYVTRPGVWVILAVYSVAAGSAMNMDFQVGFKQSVAPGPPQQGRVLFLTDPESILSFDKGVFDHSIGTAMIFWFDTVDGQTAERVFSDGRRESLVIPGFSARHLRQLKECSHLKTLDLRFRGQLKDDEWQTLGDLIQLEALKYDGVVSPFGMRQIARLTRLRLLDLTGCTFQEGFDGLESLAHLRTLVLDSFTEDRVHILGQLRQLPHIDTLVATSYRTARSKITRFVWETELENLRAATILRHWFVEESFPGFPGFDVLNHALPEIDVRPIQACAARQMVLFLVVMLTAILFCLLVLQLLSHFAHPAACLTPGYAVPHLIAAAALWLCGLATNVWLLKIASVPLLPALGVSLGISVVPAGIGFSLPGSKGLNWILGTGAVLWSLTFAFPSPINQSSIDWYLRGEQPGLALALIAAGVFVCGLCGWRISRLHLRLQELGMDPPPLAIDRGQFIAWQERAVWRRGGGRSWWPKLTERQLERTIAAASRASGWQQRSSLWIAGNVLNSWRILLLGMVLAPTMWLGAALVGNEPLTFSFVRGAPGAPNPVIGLLTFPDYGLLWLGSVWWSRRRLLAVESLRPVSRSQFARELAFAIGRDFVPFACFYVGAAVLLTFLSDSWQWSSAWTAALALYLAARVAVVFGCVLCSLTFRGNWRALLIGVVIGFVYFVASLISTLLFLPALGVQPLPPDLPHLSQWQLLALGPAWGLVAAAVITHAMRRWNTVEWDVIARS